MFEIDKPDSSANNNVEGDNFSVSSREDYFSPMTRSVAGKDLSAEYQIAQAGVIPNLEIIGTSNDARGNTFVSAELKQARQGQEDFKFESVMRVAKQNEWVVPAGSDKVANGRNLQKALDESRKAGGGTITLEDGVYAGTFKVSSDTVIRAKNRDKAVFDMSGMIPQNGRAAVFTVEGKNVRISDLKIENWGHEKQQTPPVGVEIYSGSSNVVLEGLQFNNMGYQPSRKDIGASRWGSHAIRAGTFGKNIDDVLVKDCSISNMRLGQHEAISFMANKGDVNRPKVIGCKIDGIDNIGIVMEGSKSGKVLDFEIRGNYIRDADNVNNTTYSTRDAAAIQIDTNVGMLAKDGQGMLRRVRGGVIEGNVFEKNFAGIIFEREKAGEGVGGVQVTSNTFRGNTFADIWLDARHIVPGMVGPSMQGISIVGNQYTKDEIAYRDFDPKRKSEKDAFVDVHIEGNTKRSASWMPSIEDIKSLPKKIRDMFN